MDFGREKERASNTFADMDALRSSTRLVIKTAI